MAAQPGTVVGGDFKIVQGIAQGGMGEVYIVEQISTGKRRALKLMKPELSKDSGLIARFEQEARIGSRIESDHIVEVVGAGVDAELGAPWLAMELLQGENLAQLIARRGPLPPHEARILFAQIGHALGAAHRAGVVHRDLKPENIFVARVRELGVDFKVKILDFGIAKLFEHAQGAATGAMSLGTPRYMAPEQTGGQPITPQTDVWALGLIAFQVLTSRFYWKRAMGGPNENVMTLMREVLFEPMVPASRRAMELGGPPVPTGFDGWFARCVAREPSERYRDANEAMAALDPILAGAAATMSAPMAASHAPPPAYPPSLTNQSSSTPAMAASPLGTSLVNVPLTRSAPAPSKSNPALLIGLIVGAVGLSLLGGAWVYSSHERSKKAKQQASDDEDDDKRSKRRRGDLPAKLAGDYDVSGTLLDGSPYTTKLTIRGQDTGPLELSWATGYSGLGLRSGEVLGVGFSTNGGRQYGVSVYDVDKGHLVGNLVSANEPGTIIPQVLDGPPGLEGLYVLTHKNEPSAGVVTIVKIGNVYDVSYTSLGVVFSGVGVLAGKKFVVGWAGRGAQVGVMVYTGKGDGLEARWTELGQHKLGEEKAEPSH